MEIAHLVVAGNFGHHPHVVGDGHGPGLLGLLVGGIHGHGQDGFLRGKAADLLLRPGLAHLDVEADFHIIVGIGIRRRRAGGMLGLLLLHLLPRLFHLLLHLLEGHHRVGVLEVVDLGDRFLVEIDDFDGVGRDAGHAVVFEVNGGDDRVAGLARLGTEPSGHLHHADQGSAGDLGGLLVGVVGKQKWRGGKGQGDENQGTDLGSRAKHTHGSASRRVVHDNGMDFRQKRRNSKKYTGARADDTVPSNRLSRPRETFFARNRRSSATNRYAVTK